MKFRPFLPFAILLFAAASQASGTLDLGAVTVPEELGSVKDIYEAPRRASLYPMIIFHIQDVHVNYEAQKNLAGILEFIVKRYGAKIILVEGGITDKDFSYIRDRASLEERRVKADELLKEGIISGETYLDIATDLPLKFQGIEDRGLYEKNMEIYLEVEKFRAEALGVIGSVKKAVGSLKRFVYTKRLTEYDAEEDLYRREKTDMKRYAQYLDRAASEEGVDLSGCKQFATFLSTVHLEEKIDFRRVERERDGVTEELSRAIAREGRDDLLIKSISFKNGEMTASEFYSYLIKTAENNNMPEGRLKNLGLYVEYLKSFEGLDSEGLFEDMEEIEANVSGALCKNEEQRRLFRISKDMLILEAFLNLRLMPKDFDYYRENKDEFRVYEWKKFLEKEKERFRIKDNISENTASIDSNLSVLESFYTTSFERDEAFVKNSVKKMDSEKENVAVLIAGGFHTNNLSRLFRAKGISYLVITPKLSKETDARLYDRILKDSYKTRTWDRQD